MNPLRGSKRCWALVFKCDTYIYEGVVIKILFDCYEGDVLFSGINDNRNNQQSKAIVRSRSSELQRTASVFATESVICAAKTHLVCKSPTKRCQMPICNKNKEG